MDTSAVYHRTLGSVTLLVYPELRSTNLGGAWTRQQVAKHRVDNDTTPHGNLEYVPVWSTVAPEPTFKVMAARKRSRILLGHGMTEEQARRYVDQQTVLSLIVLSD